MLFDGQSWARARRAALPAFAFIASFALLGCSSGPQVPEASIVRTALNPPATLPIDPDELEALLGAWNPTPFTLSAAAIEVVDRACRSTYPDALDAMELAIVDTRGGAIVNAWFVGATGGNFGCEGMRIDAGGVLLPAGFGSGTDASDQIPQPTADEVVAWYTTHQEAPTSTIAAAGLIGSNIADVRFTAEGKPPIVATIMNGWFAAWLPDDWPRLTIRGYDDDGDEVFADLDW